MLQAFLLLTLFFQNATATLTAPQPGEVLRGQVEIHGTMDLPNFSSAELAFSFASDSAQSWFVIQTFPQPKADSPLAIWDTTAITDGEYDLHLRVHFQDGSVQDAVIKGLKIQNEVPLATQTPTEVFEIAASAAPQAEATQLPQPTATLFFAQPTDLPANPASLNSAAIPAAFLRGALTVIIVFLCAALLLYLRKKI
ncbi:MAG: hypothetical protein IT310_09740 [Anaerolineales bacterium]|nr:hypothetical protein [Anaerolineales bacterium]